MISKALFAASMAVCATMATSTDAAGGRATFAHDTPAHDRGHDRRASWNGHDGCYHIPYRHSDGSIDDDEVPYNASLPVVMNGLRMWLPHAADGAVLEATHGSDETGKVVYASPDGSHDVVVEPTDDGINTKVVLKSAVAPRAYSFAFGADVTLEATTGTNRRAGEVMLRGAGSKAALVRAPWAVDATSARVPTYFTIRGTTLVQKVHFNAKVHKFPIVADPDWLRVTRCGLTIAAYWGTGPIARLGGVARVAKRVIKLLKGPDRRKKLKDLFYEAAGDLTGYNEIVSACLE